MGVGQRNDDHQGTMSTDNRIDYARTVVARTRLELALDLVKQARGEVGVIFPLNHPAMSAITDVALGLAKAIAQTDIVVKRLP